MERMESGFDRERRFSSDLAHEMRKTPVAELRMLIESAIKWPEEGGKLAWKTALESVDRIEGIVQTMLRLARIEQSGQEEEPVETMDLTSLLEELWEENRSQARELGVRLKLNIPPSTTVSGDPALWRHLLGNLLSNVAIYADPGSEAQVITEPKDDRPQPLIRVVNAASALNNEDVDHLFERFWRGSAASDQTSRYGLGLSLANACAAAMGLRLSARLLPETSSLEILIAPEG